MARDNFRQKKQQRELAKKKKKEEKLMRRGKLPQPATPETPS